MGNTVFGFRITKSPLWTAEYTCSLGWRRWEGKKLQKVFLLVCTRKVLLSYCSYVTWISKYCKYCVYTRQIHPNFIVSNFQMGEWPMYDKSRVNKLTFCILCVKIYKGYFLKRTLGSEITTSPLSDTCASITCDMERRNWKKWRILGWNAPTQKTLSDIATITCV